MGVLGHLRAVNCSYMPDTDTVVHGIIGSQILERGGICHLKFIFIDLKAYSTSV